MANVKMISPDGDELPVPERISGDDFDAPTVTIVVCDAGQFIDSDSPEELRFVPPPPPPVIDRLDLTVSNVGIVGHKIELDAPTSDEAAIARIEEHMAKRRGESVYDGETVRERIARISKEWGNE